MTDGLTWTCHVCHEERPDQFISVFSRVGMLGTVPYQENVRYCNDRPACARGATKVRFVKGGTNGDAQA
jgi:hypothetical protein